MRETDFQGVWLGNREVARENSHTMLHCFEQASQMVYSFVSRYHDELACFWVVPIAFHCHHLEFVLIPFHCHGLGNSKVASSFHHSDLGCCQFPSHFQ